MNYAELGEFVNKAYEVKECRKDNLEMIFTTTGTVGKNDSRSTVAIEKRYRMKRNTIMVDYAIGLENGDALDTCFAPEINPSFPSIEETNISVLQEGGGRSLESSVSEAKAVAGFTAQDRRNCVMIQCGWGERCDLWVIPVEASWMDQNGEHAGYQSTCFIPKWRIKLEGGDTWTTSIQMSLARTK